MMKLCRKTYTLIVPKSYKSCGLAVSEEKFFEVSELVMKPLQTVFQTKLHQG
jgi:hypothetical protein